MRFLIIAFITIVSSFSAQAQDVVQERHARYMDRADVRHLDNSVTVAANSPRPLAQAITALSEEYGWVIDFEDPPYYSNYDLVDDTDSKWRAAHPSAKGVTAIAGNEFQSQFPESQGTGTSVTDEERVLEKVTSDYNQSTNPGKFSVRNEGDGRFAVIGTDVNDETGQDQAISPILDTPISIPEETRDAYGTIETILDALTAKTNIKVSPGLVPGNALSRTQVSIGGQSVPARVLLLRTLSAVKVKLYWVLYYDHDVQLYMFSLLPLMKANYDASGNRTTVLVR
jgi:hypothetical protein